MFIYLFLDSKDRPVLVYAALFIAVCSALFQWLEGWSWMVSIDFVVITFTTIGKGDIVPTLPITMIITIFVALNGVAILLMVFYVMRRVRSWRRVGQLVEDGSICQT